MALPRAFEGLAGGTKALLVMVFLAWVLFLAKAWAAARSRVLAIRVRDQLALVPVAMSFAISFVRPIFTERYLVVVLPALFIGMGVGISSIRPRGLGLVAFAWP